MSPSPASTLPWSRPSRRLLLELELTRGLTEAPPSTPLQAARARHVPVLRHVVEGLRLAADDPEVAGLVVHVGLQQPSLAESGELRAAISGLRAAGKATVCWAESYGEMAAGNVGYHLASMCEEVWLQPSGDLGLTGVVAEAVFVRDALDKLGVEPQIGQREEYKTAADAVVRSRMSAAHREMAERLVASATDTIVEDVAAARGLTPQQVRDAIAHAPLPAADAVARGLVDRTGYRDEVYADLRRRLGAVQLRYVDRYRRHRLRRPVAVVRRRGRPAVAVIHAVGPIHLGRGGGRTPLSGPSVGSDTLGAALRASGRDADVRAVVLRVNSPGGSYLASDAIRREVLRLRETGRPVVASMGTVAASGGYYIAMPADVVVASAGTLTGSIGVLAGKQVLRDALGRLGVRRESVSQDRYAEMFSSQRRFSEEEWQRVEGWLDRIYDDFTAKAAHDRGLALEDLRRVAKGRVWTGADARRHGLVDRLGGLEDAIDVACQRAGVARSEVAVRTVPRRTLLDRVRPAESSERPAAAAVAEMTELSLASLLPQALAALGMPVYGVLMTPVTWRLI
ncbi:MAG: S49 family peptidase [Actinomycetota bacterium]|nr:S49 family peptidase [Actinomycetota bacterium]